MTAVPVGPQVCSCEAQQCSRQYHVFPSLPGNYLKEDAWIPPLSTPGNTGHTFVFGLEESGRN